jgi:threonine aldolase
MGRMSLEAVEAAVRPDDPHYARSRLILLENTYGAKGGFPIPPDYFAGIREIAGRHGLAVHLDGARFFNATVALGLAPQAIADQVDSVSFCLSKGLCAPVGSVLCGPADFIYRAKRMRKILGGGMRQAGILAAAGLVALDKMIDRLADDHANARLLVEGLARIPGVVVDPARCKTNIVFFGLDGDVPLSAEEVAGRCRTEGNVWVGGGKNGFRAVTHYWVGPDEVKTFLDVLQCVLI